MPNRPSSLWLWLILPACVLGACTSSSALTPAVATIENRLPADGCSYVVTVDGVEYAPDAASLADLRARNLPDGETAASIRYRLTGAIGRVECGNAAGYAELPEIAFVFDGIIPAESHGRAIATIENKLPSDGCSYVVTVGDAHYAPDAASNAAIVARKISYGTTEVAIRYRLTGNTGQVTCGFGSHEDLPEISFTFAALPTEP